MASLNHFHHLTFDRAKRAWKLRLTVGRGAKFVGKQITISLAAWDEESAIMMRDLVLTAYRKVGLEIANDSE